VSVLTPIPALIAAAVALPLLILLYFLKLRRRSLKVPSTMLWEQTRKDLEANAPFQRLRINLLLLLQAVILILVALALARPMMGRTADSASGTIVLVDVSASMGAHFANSNQSRLDRARELAAAVAGDALRTSGWRAWFAGSSAGSCAVIDFAAAARLRCALTTRSEDVTRALDAVTIREEQGDLAPALAAAESVLAALPPNASSRIVIISDGRYENDVPLSFRGPKPEFVQVASESALQPRNVGITALAARWADQSSASTSAVDVFARLISVGPDLAQTTVKVEVDGKPIQARAVRFTPVSDGLAEASLTLRVPADPGAVIRVAHSSPDDLPLDDSAALILLPRKPGRLLLVAPQAQPDSFLQRGLELVAGADNLTLLSADNFRGMQGATPVQTAARFSDFSAVIFDRVTPDFLPPIGTLSFGASLPVPGLARTAPARPLSRRVLSWDRVSPLTGALALDALAVADAHRYTLPTGASSLVLAEAGPVIAQLSAGTSRQAQSTHILVSFPLDQSNWPLLPSFVIFLKNSVDLLTDSGGFDAGAYHRADESWIARATSPDLPRVEIRPAAGAPVTLQPLADGSVPIPPLGRVGIYRAAGLAPPDNQFAVNLLAEVESDLRPGPPPIINRSPALLRSASDVAAREIWPWVAAAALAVLTLEWLAYLRKAHV